MITTRPTIPVTIPYTIPMIGGLQTIMNLTYRYWLRMEKLSVYG